jgi:hypothetical protein
MNGKSSAATREEWIDAFVKYVVGVALEAPTSLLALKADMLYPHLGRFGPIEVAQAEWEDLPLRAEQLSKLEAEARP